MSDLGFEFIKIQTCEPVTLGYQNVFKITVSSLYMEETFQDPLKQ